MNKNTIIILALLFISGLSFSQKKITLSFYGGYTLPVADLKGDFPDTDSNGINFSKQNTLLTSQGFNGGIQGKYVVDSTGSARVTAGLNYNSFSGSADYGLTSYKNKVSIFTFSAGIEYAYNPNKKIVPFGGLDIAANFFSGKVEGSGDTNFVLNRKTETRFGVIVNAGVELRLWKQSGLIIGVRYALTNLIGKSTTSATSSTITDAEEEGSSSFYELPLNDKETQSNADKTLNCVQFYVGFSFNFGGLVGIK